MTHDVIPHYLQPVPRIPCVIISLLFATVFCTGCSAFSILYFAGMKAECWQAENFPHGAESVAQFQYPDSAKSIVVKTSASASWCTVGIKFEMTATELDKLIASTRIKPDADSSKRPVHSNDYYTQDMLTLLGGDTSQFNIYQLKFIENNYFDRQYIYIDTRKGNIYTIYLITEHGVLD